MFKRALIIVDLQNDFCPGGSLEVPYGDLIVPTINKLIDKFDIIAATRDWHPINHKFFTTENDGSKPLDVIKINGKDEIVWPPHCIQNTYGSELHKDLNFNGPIFSKGFDVNKHPYSGFGAINDDGLSLQEYLKYNEIEEVFVTGLAGDYCVKDTAIDCSIFHKTYFVIDATKFIGNMNDTIDNLIKDGINIINSDDIDIILSKKYK